MPRILGHYYLQRVAGGGGARAAAALMERATAAARCGGAGGKSLTKALGGTLHICVENKTEISSVSYRGMMAVHGGKNLTSHWRGLEMALEKTTGLLFNIFNFVPTPYFRKTTGKTVLNEGRARPKERLQGLLLLAHTRTRLCVACHPQATRCKGSSAPQSPITRPISSSTNEPATSSPSFQAVTRYTA